MKYYEPEIEARIDAAKEKAQRILNGDAQNEEEFTLGLIAAIDKHKRMGIFHEYYQTRTVDELIFEAELTMGVALTPVERGAQVMARATEEDKAELSMDLAKSFGDNMDENFLKDAMEFMSTGAFKDENQETE